ncbi:Mitochondrial Carrier (MC) protein [Phytophthora megakarya]|uniref:Mitochondrial Carrier (MC) protein n=1 Tax=Phytophthora megakarya TaxID=4795 RepID=A0A225UCS4_9STRA|nr:Mitochondrial Carrier (MC) protein [Phytophthora megakarya]
MFDGNEVYKGLGAGFEQWELLFIEQVEMAELAYGYR